MLLPSKRKIRNLRSIVIFSLVTVEAGELLSFFGNLTSAPSTVQLCFFAKLSSSVEPAVVGATGDVKGDA